MPTCTESATLPPPRFVSSLVSWLVCALGVAAVHAAGPLSEIPPRSPAVACAETPKRFENGALELCTLTHEYRMGEVTLPSGSILAFSKAGVLAEAFLGDRTMIYGQELPRQATLFFDTKGRMRHFWLREEASVQGHQLRSMGKGYTGYLGHMLYTNGKLRASWLAGEEMIDGVPCASKLPLLRGAWHAVKLGAQAMVWFYDDGHLRQAMLARDAIIQGQAFRKGDVISLRRDGTLDAAAKRLDWSGWKDFPDD